MASSPLAPSSSSSSAAAADGVVDVIGFLDAIEGLKRTQRTGWVQSKQLTVSRAESVSDHMHRMGVMAMLLRDDTVDRQRCVRMALVHDLAECIIGDLTPDCGIAKEDKHRMEKDAMRQLCDKLGNLPAANDIFALFCEYEDNATPEAHLVKDLDKFEMIVQAYEYEKIDGATLHSFFESTRGKFNHPEVKQWVEELYRKRAELHRQRAEERTEAQ